MVRWSGVAVAAALLGVIAAVPANGGVSAVARIAGGTVMLEEVPASDWDEVRLSVVRAEVQLVDAATPFSILLGGTWGLQTTSTHPGQFTTQAGFFDAALGFDLLRISGSYVRVGAGASRFLWQGTAVSGGGSRDAARMPPHTGGILLAEIGTKLDERFGVELGVRYRGTLEHRTYGQSDVSYSLGGTEVALGVAFQFAGRRGGGEVRDLRPGS